MASVAAAVRQAPSRGRLLQVLAGPMRPDPLYAAPALIRATSQQRHRDGGPSHAHQEACTALIVALGCTSASAAEFPWPDLPVLYKITRKAALPASGLSAPKAASATRARDAEGQGLIDAGGSGCSWDEGTCSRDIGPSEGWSSFGFFEVSANSQLAKVEVWGKAAQRQAAVCSGMTCNVFGVPEDIAMDPTNPGPLLAFFGIRPELVVLKTCVRTNISSKSYDPYDLQAKSAAETQLAGESYEHNNLVDVTYLDGSVWRFSIYITSVGRVFTLQGGKPQAKSQSPCGK